MKAMQRCFRWFVRKETGVQLLLIFAASAMLTLRSQVFCQTPLTADGVADFTPDAATGGGGGLPCTPAYGDHTTGGTGNRGAGTGTGAIIVTDSGNLTGLGDDNKLVNGTIAAEGNFFPSATCAGKWIQFDFGHAVLITESIFYQENSTGQGTWKWQGSSDASAWTDIGSSFAFGGTPALTMTSLSGNTTGYRYYRIIGVSGSTSNNPWVYEFEFKICNTP